MGHARSTVSERASRLRKVCRCRRLFLPFSDVCVRNDETREKKNAFQQTGWCLAFSLPLASRHGRALSLLFSGRGRGGRLFEAVYLLLPLKLGDASDCHGWDCRAKVWGMMRKGKKYGEVCCAGLRVVVLVASGRTKKKRKGKKSLLWQLETWLGFRDCSSFSTLRPKQSSP